MNSINNTSISEEQLYAKIMSQLQDASPEAESKVAAVAVSSLPNGVDPLSYIKENFFDDEKEELNGLKLELIETEKDDDLVDVLPDFTVGKLSAAVLSESPFTSKTTSGGGRRDIGSRYQDSPDFTSLSEFFVVKDNRSDKIGKFAFRHAEKRCRVFFDVALLIEKNRDYLKNKNVESFVSFSAIGCATTTYTSDEWLRCNRKSKYTEGVLKYQRAHISAFPNLVVKCGDKRQYRVTTEKKEGARYTLDNLLNVCDISAGFINAIDDKCENILRPVAKRILDDLYDKRIGCTQAQEQFNSEYVKTLKNLLEGDSFKKSLCTFSNKLKLDTINASLQEMIKAAGGRLSS